MQTDHLTIVIPYYNAPMMLDKQIDYWLQIPAPWAEKLLVILIDDGSQKHPAEPAILNRAKPVFEIQLFRIKTDIPWNYTGAKNLGMWNAPDGWCYLSDIDHVLPLSSIQALFDQDLNFYCSYMMKRSDMITMHDFIPIHTHSESHIITKEKFFEIGGYNEDFAGYYYDAPTDFHHRLRKTVAGIEMLESVRQLHFGTSIISDSHVTSLSKTRRPDNYVKGNGILRFEWERLL